MADSDIEIGDIEDYIYTSEAIMPEPQVVWKEHAADKSDVVLTAGEDFKDTYTSNIDAGLDIRLNLFSGILFFFGILCRNIG